MALCGGQPQAAARRQRFVGGGRTINPGRLGVQKSTQSLREQRWYGVCDLKSLRGHAGIEMKPIREALEPSALACGQAPVLERMDASRCRWLPHVRRERHRRFPARQARVGVVEPAARLKLIRDRAPVAAIGDERDRLDEMRRVIADRVSLKASGVLPHEPLIRGSRRLVVVHRPLARPDLGKVSDGVPPLRDARRTHARGAPRRSRDAVAAAPRGRRHAEREKPRRSRGRRTAR
jgi:hypothetical protein